MLKHVLSVLLTFVLILAGAQGAVAAEAAGEPSLEQRIDGMTLSPQPMPDWARRGDGWYDFSRVDRIVARGLGNYDTLRAVFLDVAENTSAEVTSCTTHRMILGCALEMAGFETWEVSGLVTAKNGGLPFSYGSFPEGWTGHSWTAVVVDGPAPDNLVLWETHERGPKDIGLGYGYGLDDIQGEILFFDVNLYSVYGMSFDQCFAVPPESASWYQNAGLVFRTRG